MKRQSGILMPIFSLPSEYGIGDFGKTSYKFIDFLKDSGQKLWQVLPLVQTGFGNSPYSSVSSKSFNPYFISVEGLYKDGLISLEQLNSAQCQSIYIDYEFLYNSRFSLLRVAFDNFDTNEKGFKKFVKAGEYFDYAMFMAIKHKNGQKDFIYWQNGLKKRNKKSLEKFYKQNEKEVLFWQFVQYRGQLEWQSLKKYANQNGIKIIGDIPLYVALDSVDVWVNPKLFKLNKNYIPTKVAGVPPDYFCQDGQLWGNPVYDYSKHQKDKFSWWVNRIKTCLKHFDYLRIDHFRGLDRYYEINYGEQTARNGEWIDVPHDKLFKILHQNIDKRKIIAEDLGIIDDGVKDLIKDTGYPGMKILSFAFNGEKDNLYLPENIIENSVCFTGTHDNDTLLGLISNCSDWDYNNLINGVKESLAKANISLPITDSSSLVDAMVELGFYTKSKMFIMPFADVIKCDTSYRINEPGSIKQTNWSVRFSKEQFSEYAKQKLLYLTKKYNR